MRSWSLLALLGLSMVSSTLSFSPRLIPKSVPYSTLSPHRDEVSRIILNSKSSDTKKKTGVEEGMRSKLISESIAPWRGLRLFLYGALGSGAFIGGLITLSGTMAALSGTRTDVDLNAEYLNLAIDFGAVTIFAFLAKLDLDKKAELDESVEEKIEKKKEKMKVAKGMREREKLLGTQKLQIQVSADGSTREASVKELQAGARQHMIIVAGPKKACRDALVGANLLKMDFALSNVLVVPYDTEAEAQAMRPDGRGFGELPKYETQPYVARAVGDGWDEYIKAEMDDAVEQNGEKTREEGIAIVVARNGKVIRRGVGKVPWRQMVEQLEETMKESS